MTWHSKTWYRFVSVQNMPSNDNHWPAAAFVWWTTMGIESMADFNDRSIIRSTLVVRLFKNPLNGCSDSENKHTCSKAKRTPMAQMNWIWPFSLLQTKIEVWSKWTIEHLWCMAMRSQILFRFHADQRKHTGYTAVDLSHLKPTHVITQLWCAAKMRDDSRYDTLTCIQTFPMHTTSVFNHS